MFKDKKLCRTCLTSERELIPISAAVETDMRIVDYFRTYLGFPIVEDDDLPQSVCLKCLDNLLEVKKFYLQCKDSEDYLNGKMLSSLEEIIEDDSMLDSKSEIVIIEKCAESPPCEDSYSSEDIIEYAPMEIVSLDEAIFSENYKCDMCDESFKHEKNLKMHVKVFHNCEETEQMPTHEEDADPEEQIENSNAAVAEESTNKTDAYRCLRCGCSFRYKRNYENHMKRHKSDTTYKCPDCKKTFFTEASMQKHYRTMHVLPKNDESCLCPLCGAHFCAKKNLDVHMETHNEDRKKYTCESCDKTFFRKDSLICHMRTHTGERPFECEICHKRFTQKNALVTHMTLHTGKPVKCPLCDKTFSRPSFLKVHNREHTDERPYACDMCPKRYRQMTHLRAHQYIHFNLKPFSCDICGKSYTQKSTLSQHLFTHIGKPFKCPACTMKFIRPYRFRQHLINTHSIFDDPQKFRIDVNNPESGNEDVLEENYIIYKEEFEENNDDMTDANNVDEIEIDITNL